MSRGDEWSLRAFASMPSTAIFLRAQAEIKNLLCELASNAKIWGARASKHSFKFCEQLKILVDHSSPLSVARSQVHQQHIVIFSYQHKSQLDCGLCINSTPSLWDKVGTQKCSF